MKFEIADNFEWFYFKRLIIFSLPVILTLLVQFYLNDLEKFIKIFISLF